MLTDDNLRAIQSTTNKRRLCFLRPVILKVYVIFDHVSLGKSINYAHWAIGQQQSRRF